MSMCQCITEVSSRPASGNSPLHSWSTRFRRWWALLSCMYTAIPIYSWDNVWDFLPTLGACTALITLSQGYPNFCTF